LGIKTRYPNEAPFSTAVTSASLPLFDIKPTIAYKLNDQLSVGVGADIYTFAGFLGSGQLEIKNNWPGGGGIPAGTPVELNGKDTAAGFNVSLLYTPYRNDEGKPLVNIGLVYRSQATLHLNGEFLVNGAVASNSSATLVLPQVLTGAFAVWPLRDQRREWKLEMDVDYAGWKSNRNLDVRLSNGGLLPFPQNWRSSYVIMLGTEYKWLKPNSLPEWNIAARAGYWRSQTGIPDQTFNPAVPDSDNHAVSVGLGLLCQNNGKFLGLFECGGQGMGKFRTKAIGLDLAYQAVLYETRTISGNINPTVNGTYRTTLHVGAVNLRVDF
jgi:long-chain fatty acid transport protein